MNAIKKINQLKYEIRRAINKSNLDLPIVELVLDSLRAEVMAIEMANEHTVPDGTNLGEGGESA